MRQLPTHACRFSAILLFSVACSLAATASLGADDSAGIAEYQPGTPFTYLFDTGSRSAHPLSPKALAAKDGWTLIPEDETEHEFQGDTVLTNDKLAVVLRREGPGAEVYSQAAGGARFRAVVMSAPRKAVAVTGAPSLRIVENGLGAVMVEADLQGDGQSGACTAAFRLTTGQAMLEMTGLGAADRFFVWSVTRYVVVPDFFADDMVFSAATCDLNRFGLPAENFLLNLLDGGDAMLTCVWRSPNQDAYAVLTGEGPERRIHGCEFAGGEDETLWVAVVEQPDIWHGALLTGQRDTRTDWEPPFDASWRFDVVSAGPLTGSLDLSRAQIEKTLLGELDRRDRSAEAQETQFALPAGALPTSVLLYPLDRNASTPLTTFCPTDVLRSTLGVGPCQYILRTEGLASDADPTPANVMDWVEEQFDKGKEAESTDQIRKRLGGMIGHMEHVQARIDEYRALVKELRTLSAAEEGNANARRAAQTVVSVLSELEQTIASSERKAEPAARASELAEQVVGLIGKGNAPEACQGLAVKLRLLGALQDLTLSRCRMLLRWLRQEARMCAIREPDSAEFAREVQSRVERFLAEKQGSADQ